MTVKMAKTAAATIASDITGRTPPLADELGVICLMDMGNTAALMKAYPVLPPRQSSYMKKAVWAKWLKVSFEKYYLFKMKHGISNLP
jgi:sulfide:quinone oxidoreductase